MAHSPPRHSALMPEVSGKKGQGISHLTLFCEVLRSFWPFASFPLGRRQLAVAPCTWQREACRQLDQPACGLEIRGLRARPEHLPCEGAKHKKYVGGCDGIPLPCRKEQQGYDQVAHHGVRCLALSKSHFSSTKNQPKEDGFGTNIPWTSGGHSRRYPGPKFRSGRSKSWKNKHLGADIHDPKVRTSITLRDFQKLWSEKLRADFLFSNFMKPRTCEPIP